MQKYFLFFLFAFFFSAITYAEEISFRFGNDFSHQQLKLKNVAPKLTHFIQLEIDMSKIKDKTCNGAVADLKEALPYETNEFISTGHLYCRQTNGSDGLPQAVLLRLNHIVESKGTIHSSKELNLFLNKYKDFSLYGQKQQYFPVESITKLIKLRARHSFYEVSTLHEEVLSYSVKDVAEYIANGLQFWGHFDLKNKTAFISHLQNNLNSQDIAGWEGIFADKSVDVLDFYTTNNIVTVNSNGESKQLIAGVFLYENLFIDTRWDEGEDGGTEGKVCLKIDTEGTDNAKYPNIAMNIISMSDRFYVHHQKTACFDLKKTYYMQYFLKEAGTSLWYGTVCRYLPFRGHEGKTLHYIGEHGHYKCPVIAE